ncbi:MAG: glycine oxidase ThiO [Solirubrobacteraceae bacterium]
MASHDVIIVGGGAIGLSVAWRCAQRGADVVLLERGELGGGASRVAAGMLAPASEAQFGAAGARLLELGLRSAELWPAWAHELGLAEQLCSRGTLRAARDADEAEALERELDFHARAGLTARRLRASEARELEPALAPTLRLAALFAQDSWIDPRALVPALAAAAAAAGAQLREHSPVSGVAAGAIELADGRGELRAERVVLAAGAWSGELLAGVPVRPVKGQIMRLRDPAGPGLLSRVVRFDGGYVVPRADGRYVVGASVEERGFDEGVTAGAMHELLRSAAELVPGLLELELEEFSAGLRPGTPDNVPLIGPGPGGVILATGHYRNGILLAPVTAEILCEQLCGVAA